MNIEFGIFVNLMDHEKYLMTHEMQLFGGEKISRPRKTFFMVTKKIHGHEKLFPWWRKNFMATKNFFHGL